MHRVLSFFSIVLTLLFLIPGCPSEPPADATGSVVLGVTSDLRVGVDIDRVHVLMKAGGETIRDDVLTTSGSPKLALPAELTFSDRADGELVEATLEAFLPGGSTSPLVTRYAATKVVAGKTLLMRVMLDSRCAIVPGSSAPVCDAPKTCVAGTCADGEVDALHLEPYTPGWATTTTDICKPAGAGAPIVTVGEGQSDYLPTSDGEVAQVEAGPQGGHHIWVAIRMKNLTQSGSITSVTGHFSDLGYDVGPFNVIFTFDQDEGGFCKLYGLRFQLDADHDIHDMLGHVLDVKVTVTDQDGAVGVGKRTVKLSDDFI